MGTQLSVQSDNLTEKQSASAGLRLSNSGFVQLQIQENCIKALRLLHIWLSVYHVLLCVCVRVCVPYMQITAL